MAMTKKERADIDAQLHALRLKLALRWSEPCPPNLPPPSIGASGMPHTEGWMFNFHSMRVDRAWSERLNHGHGEYRNGAHRAASQGSRSMYISRLDALRGMRNAIERDAAEKLLKIDEMIAAESNDTPTSA